MSSIRLVHTAHGTQYGGVPFRGTPSLEQFSSSLSSIMASKGSIRQILAAFTVSLAMFSSGISFAWITQLLVSLLRGKEELKLTEEEASWVVSLIEVGNLFAPLPAGFLTDYWGRKWLIFFTAPVYIASWVAILATKTVNVLYVARLAQGAAMSVCFTIVPMYLAEIAETRVRGFLGSFFQGMWNLGILYEYIVGAFVGYQTLTWFSIVPPMIFMVTFVWFPESPFFLLMRGRREEALKALRWLRGTTEVEGELQLLERDIAYEKEMKGHWKDLFKTKEGRKGLFLITILSITEIMSGMSAVLSYATLTFYITMKSEYKAKMMTIGLGATLTISIAVSGLLVDRWGRRPIILLSSFGSSIFLGCAATYYFIVLRTNLDLSAIDWAPAVLIILYMVLITFGVCGLFGTLQAELFSNSTRGLASALAVLELTVLSIVVLKIYQMLERNMGLDFIYCGFTLFCLTGAIFLTMFLPETRGKTFEEIQRSLT